MHGRQVEPESGALADLAVGTDMTAGLLQEAKHHREPQAGALTRLLGREEWLEYVVEYLVRDAGSSIVDLDRNIVAGRHLRVRRSVILVQVRVAGGDRQLPTPRHGVAGVGRQVGD